MANAYSEPSRGAVRSQLAAFAVAALAVAATAATADNTAVPIPAGQLKWVSQPTPEQIAHFTPVAPRVRGLDAKISFICSVAPTRMLHGCTVAQQTPEGMVSPYVLSQALGLYQADNSVPIGQSVSIEFAFPHPTLNSASPSTLARPPVRAQDVHWQRVPTPALLSRYYPDRAMRMNQGGASSIQCQVMDDLLLSNCVVQDEAPAGFRFGDAAVSTAMFYSAASGTPIGERVIIKINWTLPK